MYNLLDYCADALEHARFVCCGNVTRDRIKVDDWRKGNVADYDEVYYMIAYKYLYIYIHMNAMEWWRYLCPDRRRVD